MPNRIIKESICTSDSIAELSWIEESFFYRLIVTVDDFGRYDGRASILKGRLFPLKDVTEKQIVEILNKLSSVGIVRTYEVEDKPYLQIVSWERHQSIRSKKSKFPAPSQESASNCKQMQADEINCKQLHANVPVIQSNPIQSESYSKSESESESRSESNPNTESCESIYDSSLTTMEVFEVDAEVIRLNDNSLLSVKADQIKEWMRLYPSLDVTAEIRKMAAWCDANPAKRKSRSGFKKFAVGWLNRAHESQASRPKSPSEMSAAERIMRL